MTDPTAYTDADVELVAQAMRDANHAAAWQAPQIVPMGHFARMALDALATAGRLTPTAPATDGDEPTWDDVWASIGRQVWKLAPQDYQDSAHRDLTFLTCWQNIMEAVSNGIFAVAALPDEEDEP